MKPERHQAQMQMSELHLERASTARSPAKLLLEQAKCLFDGLMPPVVGLDLGWRQDSDAPA